MPFLAGFSAPRKLVVPVQRYGFTGLHSVKCPGRKRGQAQAGRMVGAAVIVVLPLNLGQSIHAVTDGTMSYRRTFTNSVYNRPSEQTMRVVWCWMVPSSL